MFCRPITESLGTLWWYLAFKLTSEWQIPKKVTTATSSLHSRATSCDCRNTYIDFTYLSGSEWFIYLTSYISINNTGEKKAWKPRHIIFILRETTNLWYWGYAQKVTQIKPNNFYMLFTPYAPCTRNNIGKLENCRKAGLIVERHKGVYIPPSIHYRCV